MGTGSLEPMKVCSVPQNLSEMYENDIQIYCVHVFLQYQFLIVFTTNITMER